MLLLAVDTSTPATSAALLDGTGLVVQRTEVDQRRHVEVLATLMAQVLAEAGARPAHVTAVAAGVGPGPFTGLRVGLASGAAFAAALDLPTYGVCSLDALYRTGPVGVLTDARRREVYWATYSETGARTAGPDVAHPAALLDRLPRRLAGAGALLYRDVLRGFDIDPTDPYPTAARIGALALERARAGASSEPLIPLYLRRPDAVPPGRPKPVTSR